MRSCPTCFVPYAEQVEFCGLDGTKLVFGETDLLLGKSVDRYRILDVVGDGGMARVYRARHETLDREYAVKVLYGEVASNKTLAERFRREARTMSRISHENVVSVSDYGTTRSGLTFLSMELIDGETLRTLIKRLGCLEPKRAAEIARQIALGLGAAHELGFVHRDLKPSNVMLLRTAEGSQVKLLDFGLVRATEIDGDVGFLTKTGQFVGTPIYMAPEQIIGGDVDPKADLYALGVVLFEMLEGRPPFTAKKLSEIRKKHLEARPPRPRAARGLEHLVMDLLAKTPEQRPESTLEVIARIDAIDLTGLGAAQIHIPTGETGQVTELLDTHAEARLASSIGSVEEGDLSSVLPARPLVRALLAILAVVVLAAAGVAIVERRVQVPPLAMVPPPAAIEPPQRVEPPPPPVEPPAPVVEPKPVVEPPPPRHRTRHSDRSNPAGRRAAGPHVRGPRAPPRHQAHLRRLDARAAGRERAGCADRGDREGGDRSRVRADEARRHQRAAGRGLLEGAADRAARARGPLPAAGAGGPARAPARRARAPPPGGAEAVARHQREH